MNEQEFHPGSVPVAVVARVYGKDLSPWLLRPVCMAKMLHGFVPASSQGGSRLAKPLAAEN